MKGFMAFYFVHIFMQVVMLVIFDKQMM